MRDPSLTIGLLSALGVIAIWSGFIVISRAGVTSGLTPHDVAAVRFMVSGAIILPFLRKWWPLHLPLGAQIVLALSGPGALYSLLLYEGLSNASAAFGGVFANGSIPIFTMLLMFVLAGERPGRWRLFAVTIIIVGGALLGFGGAMSGGDDMIVGAALFLTASAVLSVYLVGVRLWSVTPRQALAVVTGPSALLYLPLWWLALPSTMGTAAPSMIALQALYQGLGPGVLAVVLFALTARHLGPTPTAGVSATVPATAALLAVPVLGEIPTAPEWVGIAVVTAGLYLLLRRA
ncbi:DMT family transporter [Pikeienuella piscinae]|uniref:DMT family transporter n=1 Tax=Pikeienuella piscinae TaxID=2748098 RepID=A0A7L5BTL4_9RHOB|nr:DMT family transporter [Pikeienuella piscinae]QIE54802.1 DMT family transporter [Pikeienuella piscinae]